MNFVQCLRGQGGAIRCWIGVEVVIINVNILDFRSEEEEREGINIRAAVASGPNKGSTRNVDGLGFSLATTQVDFLGLVCLQVDLAEPSAYTVASQPARGDDLSWL